MERIQALGGEAISNHPNYHWALKVNDLFNAKELKLFELYNGHPEANSFGDKNHLSTEAMWDQLLSKGKNIYAVSSDDAHYFHKHSHELSNPGRGWVMVEADELTPDALMESLKNGDFYASSGVILSDVNRGPIQYEITIDLEATKKIILEPAVLGHKDNRATGLTVEFVGQDGNVLHVEDKIDLLSPKAFVSFNNNLSPYIRAKVSYTVNGRKGKVTYYAWTQPWWKK